MKRIWVAAAILVLLFTGTMIHSFYISSVTEQITTILHEAEIKAENGEWESAMRLTETAQEKWSVRDAYLYIMLRHNETDNVYTGFREVAEFIQCQEGGEYSAANARLIAELELLAEAEQLTLKNIL